MQLLGRAPFAPAAVLAQMLDHQTNILQMPEAGVRMSKPKAFWIGAYQHLGAFD